MQHHKGRVRNGMAYGVDPTRKQFYSLRQARYDALAEDLAAIARDYAAKGKRVRLLDIGTQDGVAIRHLEAHEGHANIDWSIADLWLRDDIFQRERIVEIFVGDLMQGYPQIDSDAYDVVVCEQVLEHLTDIETPIRTLARVLKPGGTLFVGVPTFPHGVHHVRTWGQPKWDRWFPPNKVRGHVQTFSKKRLLGHFADWTGLKLKDVRGFRIISGGLLRGLEEREWWWRFWRRTGKAVPGLCAEIQAVFVKPL